MIPSSYVGCVQSRSLKNSILVTVASKKIKLLKAMAMDPTYTKIESG